MDDDAGCAEDGCTCPAGTSLCGQQCQQASECEQACDDCALPRVCVDGTCGCPVDAPLYCSDIDTCVEPSSDPAHCGGCGRSCEAQESCIEGTCDSGASEPPATFRNPLNRADGSDPWLVYHGGSYYLTATTWSGELTVARATTLAGLRDASPEVIWRGDQPGRCCNFWAPEMHLLDGPSGKRWYYYFTGGGGASDFNDQRMHVLESEGEDPMGPYLYKARLVPPGSDWWAIDHSVMIIDGGLYVIFSQWDGPNQNIYVAPMENPWTISGPRVLLSTPTYPWERQTENVNEGPVALQRDGRTFVTYSASACWGPDYKLGLLELIGDDPLRTGAWMKHPAPVFQRADAAGVFGPAHNGFFKSPDGSEDWIVYHANDSVEGVCDTRRTTRAQRIDWSADGLPLLGSPLPLTADIDVPSGE